MQAASARPRGRRGRLAARVAHEMAVQSGTASGGSGSGERSTRMAPVCPTDRTVSPLDHTPSLAPLTSRLRDETGDRLTPSHTVKSGRRLRYYVSHRLITGPADRVGWRLPAPALEEVVATLLAAHLERAATGYTLLAEPEAQGAEALRAAAADLVAELRRQESRDDLLRRLVASGQLGPGQLTLTLDAQALAKRLGVTAEALNPSLLSLEAPLQLRRRGVELKLVAGERAPAPDATLRRALDRAHRWAAAIRAGEPVLALARQEGKSETFVRSRTELAFLSPRLQEAIVQGTQPLELTLERLLRTPIPHDWAEQARLFGVVG